MTDLRIHELMSHDVESVSPDTCLLDVVQTMRDRRYSCMIIAKNKIPVGVITERDLARLLADIPSKPDLLASNVASVMSKPPVTIGANETLFEALVTTRAQRLRHLPVVDEDGRLSGIVTQTDLTNTYFHLIEKQRDIIEHSVNERTQELVTANEELKELSLEDPLLGIGNRRAMEVDLQHTHALWRRHQQIYSVALLDVDYFKRYNDHYGHQAGDDTLKRVAECLRASTRESDRVYRYGGEKMLLLLPNTDIKGAHTFVCRTREKLKNLSIEHCHSPYDVITVSAGVASAQEVIASASWKDLLVATDDRLYLAKDRGRNQVMSAA